MPTFNQFTKHSETVYQKVLGRHHHWYFNAEISQGADTYMVRVVMDKGGSHPFHRHPEMNEILYILKGTAEQWIETESQILGPGDAVYIDPNVVHATYNIGDDQLEFLAILAPAKGWAAGTIDEFENLPYRTLRNGQ